MPSLKRPDVDEAFLARLKIAVAASPSVSALGRAIDRSEGAIRNWLDARSQPNATDLILLCRATDTRSEWLLEGKGERMVSAQQAADDLARQCADENHFSRDLVFEVVRAVEAELAAVNVKPSPAKTADLVVALCRLFRRDQAVQQDAVQMMVRVAT